MNNIEKLQIKLGINPSAENFIIFINCVKKILKLSGLQLENLKDWKDVPLMDKFSNLDSKELKIIQSKVQSIKPISIRHCQLNVQKLLDQKTRKRFAAYYTIEGGTHIMTSLARKYVDLNSLNTINLADPFIGSGLTVTSLLKNIDNRLISKIWGIEPLRLPAFVAFTSLYEQLDGNKEKITIFNTNAFKIFSNFRNKKNQDGLKADIILTNPPFTRWKYINKPNRVFLMNLMDELGYLKYLPRKEPSLQIVSMFLIDKILNKNGLLLSVLPASTFYTIYGSGLKELLLNNYNLYALIENKSHISFSEDSGFKEIIIVCSKGQRYQGSTYFINQDMIESNQWNSNIFKQNLDSTDTYNLKSIPHFFDMNWLSLFDDSGLITLVNNILKDALNNNTLNYFKDVFGEDKIIRGLEMYGPNFFFIPNKYWNISKDTEKSVEIINEKSEKISFHKKYLIATLRKPNLYNWNVFVDINHYMLNIPELKQDRLPRYLQRYIKWGKKSGTAKPAINSKGEYWYSHVYRQVKSKKPFAHLFIPDKIDLHFKYRSVFSNYSKTKLAASKNFYMIKSIDKQNAKLLAAWLNSSLFLSIFLLLSRKISKTWTRFLLNDYLQIPIINITNIKQQDINTISESLINLNELRGISIWDQLEYEERQALDIAILKSLKLNNPSEIMEKLYSMIKIKISHFF
ncbi:MAG: restriction endonuclease subunit M [Candidatus Lokiarchaeota archaeon]|nr:restriction endonuclease subunit M [Candidatus Lokiarchaeota archaeon]